MHLDNIEKKLIAVFAVNSAAELEANNGARLKEALGNAKYRQLVDSEDYRIHYNTLKELRDKLDTAVEGTEKLEQVKECLRLLKETKEDYPGQKVELLSQLIRQGLYNSHWQPDEREYYDTGWEMLAGWKDYFLSYTNRNLIETNNDFKEILNHVFGTEFQNKREEINWVARLIVHYLKTNNLTAFFDQDNMTCGDVIHDQVYNHCKSVFSFVQLVEPVIFRVQDAGADGDAPPENWCYLEFNTFDQWSTGNHPGDYKRFYFILTEKKVFPPDLPNRYDYWKKKITKHRNVPDLSSLNKKEIREKVWEIANQIKKTRNRMLDDYID